jgi:glycosyltransferase involved in cell wall biosynthesis
LGSVSHSHRKRIASGILELTAETIMMNPSVAIVHEWLSTYAGSERVVEQMLAVLPDAELFTLVDFLSEQREMLGGREVHTSFIQRLPFSRKRFRGYLPLMPLAVEQFDLSKFDIVISSHHAVANGALTTAGQLHISYVHTPVRYAWGLTHQYLRESTLTHGLRGMIARSVLHYLRLWDRAAADRVDLFVANSHYIARRIWKTYRRKARVIYPPVDVEAYELVTDKSDYYLTASRMVPYKKIDLIVDAFSSMPGRRLIVAGDGPERKKIAAKAAPNIEMVGYQPGGKLRELMQNARAFVFAADEDFGIMPVEAQAGGTPVVAFGRGGALETVIDGQTGLFFYEQTVPAICDAVERFEARRDFFDPAEIRAHAERFGVDRFRREFSRLVDRQWQKFNRGHEIKRAVRRASVLPR